MAKGIYFGVDGISRKAKKLYFGVDGIARKVKKVYVGVDNVARLCYTAGVSSRGAITALSSARYSNCGTYVGNYALIAGGYDSTASAYSAVVETYYKSTLVKGTATSLNVAKITSSTAETANHALIAFGTTSTGTYLATVNAYDAAFARTDLTASVTRGNNAASTSFGGYAIFHGGTNADIQWYMDVFNDSLTLTRYIGLSMSQHAMTYNNNYFMYAGGRDANSNDSADVRAYNSSLTLSSSNPTLSVARYNLAGAGTGTYALFAGGKVYGNVTEYATVDAIDTLLVRTVATPLSVARSKLMGVTAGGYAVFIGGKYDETSTGHSNAVDYYDSNLVRNSEISLVTGRSSFAVTKIGSDIIVAGGQIVSGASYTTTSSVEALSF